MSKSENRVGIFIEETKTFYQMIWFVSGICLKIERRIYFFLYMVSFLSPSFLFNRMLSISFIFREINLLSFQQKKRCFSCICTSNIGNFIKIIINFSNKHEAIFLSFLLILDDVNEVLKEKFIIILIVEPHNEKNRRIVS